MKYNPKNQKLLDVLEQVKEDPESIDIVEYLDSKKHSGFEFAETLYHVYKNNGMDQDAFDLICEILSAKKNKGFITALKLYCDILISSEMPPEDLVGVIGLISEVTEDIHTIKMLIRIYGQLERYNDQVLLLDQVKKTYPDDFTEEEIVTTYIFSGIPKYVKKAHRMIEKQDLSKERIDRVVNLGSAKFYAGHVKDGLIYHFGGEDFRPKELRPQKSIPNGETTDFNGKKILITTYRGMGDSMILSRFIPKFLEKWPEARLFIATEKPMIPLYEGIEEVEHVGDTDSCIGMGYDYVLGINMLARYLRDVITDENDNLYYHEWVKYPQSYDDKWSGFVDDAKTVIGINWKGSQRLGGGTETIDGKNLSRDVPFEDFIEVINQFPQCQFVCLNPDIWPEERKILETYSNVLFPNIEDFGDTSALINLTDVVLSIDTSISTLSATLSKDTIVMAKYVPDYRWGFYEKWWDLSKLNIHVYRKPTTQSSWTSVLFRSMNKLKEYVE